MARSLRSYGADLDEGAQGQLLELHGVEKPADMNWDHDLIAVATIPAPVECLSWEE